MLAPVELGLGDAPEVAVLDGELEASESESEESELPDFDDVAEAVLVAVFDDELPVFAELPVVVELDDDVLDVEVDEESVVAEPEDDDVELAVADCDPSAAASSPGVCGFATSARGSLSIGTLGSSNTMYWVSPGFTNINRSRACLRTYAGSSHR